ncbi:EfeM/EfeO family lipoprotein [Nocardioides stalactiti]|uniref:EfeM/EfeO family lipoprotein n=1 Tax=Nocardioides stalactiti TaxID=2755356 RepID=UPI0015FFA896|nr:EfeM/EfeO family lipoprotein [Nocardioides stalactiti]
MNRLSLSLAGTALAAVALTGCAVDDKPGLDGPEAGDVASRTPTLGTEDQQLVDTAKAGYASYVSTESDDLLETTARFVELFKDGSKDDEARALYREARSHWGRIETVAESFGDLASRLDAREADVDVEAGEEWTGWHRIEKDLWPARAGKYRALTPQERASYADDLLATTEELDARIQGDLAFSVDEIADISLALVAEAATDELAGDEEYWSGTALDGLQANIDGARFGFEGVLPLFADTDPALATEITERFATVQRLLGRHRDGVGFVPFEELSRAEVRALATAVQALSEPLSRLGAALG